MTSYLQFYLAAFVWITKIFRYCGCETLEDCIKDKAKAVSRTYVSGILTGIAIGIAIIVIPQLVYLIYRKKTSPNDEESGNTDGASRERGTVIRSHNADSMNGKGTGRTTIGDMEKRLDQQDNGTLDGTVERADAREDTQLKRSARGTLQKAIKNSSRWIVARSLKRDSEEQTLKSPSIGRTKTLHGGKGVSRITENQRKQKAQQQQPQRSYSVDYGLAWNNDQAIGANWKETGFATPSKRKPRSKTVVENEDHQRDQCIPPDCKSFLFTIERGLQSTLEKAACGDKESSSSLARKAYQYQDGASFINASVDKGLGSKTAAVTTNSELVISSRRRKFNSFPRLSKGRKTVVGDLSQKNLLENGHLDGQTGGAPAYRPRSGTEQLESLRVNLEWLSKNIEHEMASCT